MMRITYRDALHVVATSSLETKRVSQIQTEISKMGFFIDFEANINFNQEPIQFKNDIEYKASGTDDDFNDSLVIAGAQ